MRRRRAEVANQLETLTRRNVDEDNVRAKLLNLFASIRTVRRCAEHHEPGVRGDTVSNVTKPATLETGAVVQVPLFVNVGDRIKVDPREKRYISRA